MNAALLEKLVAFREKNGLQTAKVLLSQKVRYQYAVIHQKMTTSLFLAEIDEAKTLNALLLVEARAAKGYWKQYGTNVGSRVAWRSRKPHGSDPCNRLLDVGYHYLAACLAKVFLELDIPDELGLFHRAQSAHARPLVYDFMEWLRPVLVDRTVLVFFRRKKKPVERLREKDIPRFVASLKRGWERRYYHNKLGYCVTLSYWTKLIMFELEKSIHNNTAFEPLFPSLRHETRCKQKPLLANAKGGVES